jgi:beta-lactamase regulating signal transducer with metallopeptidase domain
MQAFVIDLALKASVIVALAAIAAAVLQRHSAAARHLVWGVSLTAIAGLPVLTAVLPVWRIPGVPALPRPTISFDVETIRPAVEQPIVAEPVDDPVTILAATVADLERSNMAQSDATPAETPASAVDVAPANDQAAKASADQASDAGAVRFAVRPRWSVWLPVLWIGGAAIVLVTILAGLARTRWLARRAGGTVGSRVSEAARHAARRLGVTRDVLIVLADDQVMPMTWGAWRPVILLPAAAERWSAERLEAVLLHELAHVKRHDFATQLVARLACALCWFNPLVWFAARQLRVERELACDDLVLAAGSRASDYAQQLLDIARSLKAQPLIAAATVAMARPSQLAGRLLAVLDAGRARGGVTRGAVATAVAIAALVAVPVAGANVWAADGGSKRPEAAEPRAATGGQGRPEVDERQVATGGQGRTEAAAEAPTAASSLAAYGRPWLPVATQGCDWLTDEQHTSASTNVSDDRTRIRIEIENCRIDVDVEGEVRFTENFTDVARLSRGGSFEVEERVGRDRRRLEVTQENGGLARRWWVNGDERPYDAEARAWLGRTLTVVFRRTGFHAQERAEWLMRTRGLQGLLAEVDSISSDYAAGRYYQVILAQPNLEPSTVQRLVRQAGARIDSDHALGQILLAVARHQTVDENVRVAYVAAAQSIDSDFTKRQVLSAILQRPGLSAEVATAMLQQATTLDSDHELSTLLRELIAAHPIEQSMTPTFFQAVNSIDSDFARRQVLIALLEKGSPGLDILNRALEAAGEMDSDHELGNVLLKVAELYPVDRSLPEAYVRAAQRLDSDFVRRQVWLQLVQRESLPAATLGQLLDAAADMDSDHEQGTLLRAVIETHGVPADARAAFFRATGRLDSDFEAGRVLRAVIDKKPLDRATVVAIVLAAQRIDSDHELGRLLLHIVDSVQVDDELRNALRAAADSIESDHTRGQVLSKLYPRTSQ